MNDPNWWQPAPAGAACVLHPTVQARATCPRCGNFACTECTSNFQTNICPSCRQRQSVAAEFPFTRANWTLGGLFDFAIQMFKRDWLMLTVATVVLWGGVGVSSVIVNILQFGLNMLGTPGIVVGMILGFLVQFAVTGLFSMGIMQLSFDAFAGRKVDLARMFSVARRTGVYFVSALLFFLMIIVPVAVVYIPVFVFGDLQPGQPPDPKLFGLFGAATLVLLPVMFFLALPYSLLPAEVAATDAGPIEAIKRCFQLASGNRWRLVAILVIGILISVVGFIACCVGALPAYAFGQLLIAGVYLALRP